MDVASLFAFVSTATPQADGSSSSRGNGPLPVDQFGSALELALQGEQQIAAAWQAAPSSLPVLREPGVGALPTLAFLQAAGDGGAVPNLAGDGVNADEDPANDLDPAVLAVLAAAATPVGIDREPVDPKRHLAFGAQAAWTEGAVASGKRLTAEEPTDGKTGVLCDEPAPAGNEKGNALPTPPTIPLAADPESAAVPLSAASGQHAGALETPSNESPDAMPREWSTRPLEPGTGRRTSRVNTSVAPDGGLPSAVVPLTAVSTDGVAAAEGHPGSVPGFDPAPVSAASSEPVLADAPARMPGVAEHRPVTAEDLRAATEVAPQALPAAGSQQPLRTSREGWRAPEGIPAQATGTPQYATPAPFVRPDSARLETPAAPVLDGPAGTSLPVPPRAWPPVEMVATPGPATALPGAQSNPQPGSLPGAQTVSGSGTQLAAPAVLPATPGVGEPLPMTDGVVGRRVDTIPPEHRPELPELVEGRASKAYQRSQADVEIQTPGPETTTRTMGAAEPRGTGDRQPERDARHNHAARQPFVSAPFIESLGGSGGLDHVFGVRTSATPGGDSNPAAAGPTSGGEPLDQAIVKSLKLQWNQGAGEARLRLHPEFLGDLSVSLRVIGASVTAVLQSDSAAVREWIQAHQGDLRRALEQAGLSLDRLVVDADGHPQEQQEQSAQHRPRQSNRRKPEAGRFEALL